MYLSGERHYLFSFAVLFFGKTTEYLCPLFVKNDRISLIAIHYKKHFLLHFFQFTPLGITMYFILHTLLAFALEPDQVIFNKAATEMNNGNPDGCMKILSSEGREYLYLKKMQELAYICAVSASNLNAANIVRKELGLFFLTLHAMDIHHAWMLQNEGKYQDALDTLVPEGWRTRKNKEKLVQPCKR